MFRGEIAAPKVVSLVRPAVVFVGGAERSGKGGGVILLGYNLRGWSTRVASSVLGLGAECVCAFVLLREVCFCALFGERAMVVSCVG